MLKLCSSIALASLSAFLVTSTPLQAQQPSRTSATYDGWTVNCVQQNDKKMACQVNQIQQPQGQPGPASEVAFSQLPGGKTVKVTIQVPPNVSISQGVRLVLEGKAGKDNKRERIGTPISAALRLCIASRCVAEADVPEDALRNVLRAEAGVIVFNQADQREVSIQFSLQGFAAAWKEAQKDAGGTAAATRR